MAFLDNERDDFWDVHKLVPKRKNTASPFVTKPVLREHEVGGESKAPSDDCRLDVSKYAVSSGAEVISYVRERGLIKSITVRRLADKYDFYGGFRKAAELYFDYKTDKCEFVPFYSYMPQYSQMSQSQKDYYFYWRDCFRRSKYIKCDYSYLYLFVYEILNLPDKIPPKEGIVMLCTLWREYRKSLVRIDSYFSIWVQDYALVYNIECPMEIIRDFIFRIISSCGFKEFYISDFDFNGDIDLDGMLEYLSDYDFLRGRYVSEKDADEYKKMMYESMMPLLSHLFKRYILLDTKSEKISRVAFPHSLCTHSVKANIEIEYIPISRDEELRRMVTLGVRYTENKIRAVYGVKSRLGVKDFPDEYKCIIDGYFEEYFEVQRRKSIEMAKPEYERLYDAESTGFSMKCAEEIEKNSWVNAAMLTDEVEETADNEEKTEQKEIDSCDIRESVDSFGLSNDDFLAIELALSKGISDEYTAERINEAFADGFGDIILISDGGRYVIIEDYREEIEEWLKRQKG